MGAVAGRGVGSVEKTYEMRFYECADLKVTANCSSSY